MSLIDDKKCVGRPIGWNGGEVKFCNADVQIGKRFCFRCHIVAIAQAADRVATLEVQVKRATKELNELIAETTDYALFEARQPFVRRT